MTWRLIFAQLPDGWVLGWIVNDRILDAMRGNWN